MSSYARQEVGHVCGRCAGRGRESVIYELMRRHCETIWTMRNRFRERRMRLRKASLWRAACGCTGSAYVAASAQTARSV